MQQTARRETAEVIWATAVRSMDALHRTTSWIRLCSVTMLWSVLPWVPPDEITHGVFALAVVTVGTLIAHVHARPGLIDVLDRLPGTEALVSHLTGARGKAAANLPGLLEGGGILIAGLAYVGPWGVTGLPEEAGIVALVAIVGYTHFAFLNTVLDAGFYAPQGTVVLGPDRSQGAPPALLLWVRHAIPSGLVVIGLVLFVPAWNPVLAAVPVSLRVLLSTSFLLLWVARISFDQFLEGTASAVEDRERVVRKEAAGDLHSLAKNSMAYLLKAVESPHYQHSEVRGLTREALVRLEELRRFWSSEDWQDTGGRVEDLWNAVVSVQPREERRKCRLDEAARGVELGSTDYQKARRLLSDLVSNALKADADSVSAQVAVHGSRRTRRIQVTVTDNGRGMPAGVLSDPQTSLALLEWDLRRSNGTLTFVPRSPGTSVVADWESN
ncbi:ATP-binding protein [Streptomyces sp. A012304]|uniref:ATP-binding protein n=1 Tax=Streptomyces sp. A012304 TaxID=375446 RepID=UPI002230D968|nr:ATP-binding protein [Streptomyces sp. A012304]GKQ37054.1 hypothetical protein ALMP_35930 [Streptomyces sp. A012304]